jgi:hypothetical protein
VSTVTVSSIGTSSRDYSTIQAWEDACPSNLTTSISGGEIWKGECYNDSEFTASLTISGVTTDSTGYLWLTTASGQSFRDDADKLTNALRYNQSNGVGVNASPAYGYTIDAASVGYTIIENLQILNSGSGSNQFCPVRLGDNSLIKNCIVGYPNQTGTGSLNLVAIYVSNSAIVAQCAIYTKGCPAIGGGGSSGSVRDCTIINSSGLSTNPAILSGYVPFVSVNNYIAGWGGIVTGTNLSASSDYNSTDLGTGPTNWGSNSRTSDSLSSTIESSTNGSEDLRLKSGNSIGAAGTRDQTYTSDVDIVGSARSTTTPSIGAWESAGGGTAYEIDAQPATFTLTASAATLLRASLLSASPATFSLTASAATLLRDSSVSASPAAFTLTASDATLEYTPVGAYTLDASPATFTLTASAATLLRDSLLNASPATFTLTASDATLTAGAAAYELDASPASFTVSAAAAGLARSGGGTGGVEPWTLIPDTNFNVAGLAYGAGLFVMVGNDGGGTALIKTSTDGITWTDRTVPNNNAWNSVTFDNGQFLCTTSNAAGDPTKMILTSPDGINWTEQSFSIAQPMYDSAYGAGTWVIVGFSNVFYYSTDDGASFTPVHTPNYPVGQVWRSVAYGNGIFIAVASAFASAAMSTDGITWVDSPISGSVGWYSITFGDGKFVAIGGNTIGISTDGLSWTYSTVTTLTLNLNGILYGDGLWVIGGAGAPKDNIYYGEDLTAFTSIGDTTPVEPGTMSWYSVAYGNGLWMLGSNTARSDGATTYAIVTSTTHVEDETPLYGFILLGFWTGGIGTPETPVLGLSKASYWVLEAKRAGTTYRELWDYISLMSIDETIVEAAVTASLYSGTTDDSATLISGSSSWNGQRMYQFLTGGTAGQIYILTATVRTDINSYYTLISQLAVI